MTKKTQPKSTTAEPPPDVVSGGGPEPPDEVLPFDAPIEGAPPAAAGVVAVAQQPTAPSLPPAVSRRDVSEAQWRTLTGSLFPGAKPSSVLMVIDYCRARGLDFMKKPCHIVPIWVKGTNGQQGGMRDVIMPGIYEYRTTAQRTGLYLGHDKPLLGDARDFGSLVDWGKRGGDDREWLVPEYCEFTVYRWNKEAQQKVAFPVIVFFNEVVAVDRDGYVNDRWFKAPVQMLIKCAEAAALRAAFPEDLGGEHTFEELEGQTRYIDIAPGQPRAELMRVIEPLGYAAYVDTLAQAVARGPEALTAAFSAGAVELRQHLTMRDVATWERLKEEAMQATPPAAADAVTEGAPA